MVVIGVGYLSYFFDSERSAGIGAYAAVAWCAMDFCSAEHRRAENDYRVQAVATVPALVPIVGIAVFGWILV